MANRQAPHFHHHHVELRRTRRRFSGALAALFVVIASVVGLQFSGIHAATNCAIKTTIGGTVYRGTTGLAGAKILYKTTTGATSTPLTNASGVWSVAGVCSQTLFDVSVSSPAPAGYTGPIAISYVRFGMTATPNYKTAASYPYQDSNFSCYQNVPANCQRNAYFLYDLASNDEVDYDFRFNLAPTPVPTPPPPTPKPTSTPAPTPKPTVKPTVKPTAAPTGGPTAGSDGAGAATDTTPPSAPTSLQALVSGSNAVVNLSWTAATDDSSGIKGYGVDRSLDQASWASLTTGLTDTTYTDSSAAFGVHYYYRVAATDNAGNVSGYATADATTGAFTSNVDGGSNVTYTSDDQLVIVEVVPGTIAGIADCSVEADSIAVGSKTHPLVSGPYQLVCKNAAGDVVSSFAKPINWSFNLKDKLNGLTNPKGTQVDAKGHTTTITSYKYDKKSMTLSFATASSDPTFVLASTQFKLPLNFIAIVFVVGLIIAGVVLLVIRRKQKLNYNEYLRSKYYNL